MKPTQALLATMGLLAAQAIQAQNPASNSGCAVGAVSGAIGTDIPPTYQGPPPSSVDKRLVGPLQLITAGTLDIKASTLTLPLYRGEMPDGRNVWYVITDTTDQANAEALGINFSAKLNYANTGKAVRNATLRKGGLLVFDRGTVDFSPALRIEGIDGAKPFPPAIGKPGSVGDADYTPLVRIANAGGHIYNAPVISFSTSAANIHAPRGNPDYRLVHDKVVAIDTQAMTVTLRLTQGFSFAKPVLYLSFDASVELAAAMEASTWAPAMNDVGVGGDDGLFSAVERIFGFINGATGCAHPQRQGFNSALLDGRSPLNVFGGVPFVATDYSPLWDLNLAEWTPSAVGANYRSRLIEEFQILAFADAGHITGPGGAQYGSTGIIINCPIVFRFL
ncbi:MAG: hypothetical protein NTZ56_13920 [Acidobacteria bacterium]|nr:hypothetical protein [Acidobacteriota bacterium]